MVVHLVRTFLVNALWLKVLPCILLINTVSAQTNVPMLSLLLFDEEQTHLQRVLAEYSNPDSRHIFIAAHRGGREFDFVDQSPGNSIANINNALSKGFDIYESDIEILGDQTLVVFHDNKFDDLTDTLAVNDLLDDATLAYAKSLRLTYQNGQVSNQQIPTLEEFLNEGMGKMMFKFDLKSGTFGKILSILDIVVRTNTQQQVLIRGGMYVLDKAKDNGYDTRIIMPRLDDVNTSVAEINNLIDNYSIRAISLPNGASLPVINAATAAGIVVEIHESQNPASLESSWVSAIDNGYRQIHSFKPSQLLAYLKSVNRHW